LDRGQLVVPYPTIANAMTLTGLLKLHRRKLLFALAALLVLFWFLANAAAIGPWWQRSGVVLRQALVTGLLIGGVYGLVALGLTLIFGVLDIINFAHGALLTVGMYITFVLFNRYGVDPYLAVLVAVPTLFVIGAIVQRLIIYPARNAPTHNQLLLTLGLALFIENLLLVIFTGTPSPLTSPSGWRARPSP